MCNIAFYAAVLAVIIYFSWRKSEKDGQRRAAKVAGILALMFVGITLVTMLAMITSSY
jgi:hypothetical protein